MKKISEVIYLQIKDECGQDSDEVTWCKDRIDKSDIPYKRYKHKKGG